MFSILRSCVNTLNIRLSSNALHCSHRSLTLCVAFPCRFSLFADVTTSLLHLDPMAIIPLLIHNRLCRPFCRQQFQHTCVLQANHTYPPARLDIWEIPTLMIRYSDFETAFVPPILRWKMTLAYIVSAYHSAFVRT